MGICFIPALFHLGRDFLNILQYTPTASHTTVFFSDQLLSTQCLNSGPFHASLTLSFYASSEVKKAGLSEG